MLTNDKPIAVIDTETNYDDEVISIGTVIADPKGFQLLDRQYLILTPECRKPAMFSLQLSCERTKADAVLNRREAMSEVIRLLSGYGVDDVFAYNAKFDHSHLPELQTYSWFDIMKIAAYRQYNHSIPDSMPCCRTGRLQGGYGAESIYRMLSGQRCYCEVHNALADAEDELTIMRLLEQDITVYEKARIRG